MTPTLRAELDRIEDFLMGPEGQQLGDILSALRGPDAPNANRTSSPEKNRTTVHIRTAAFPRLHTDSLYRRDFPGFSPQQGWQMVATEPFSLESLSCSHFRNHVRSAATVLGLVSDHEADARR